MGNASPKKCGVTVKRTVLMGVMKLTAMVIFSPQCILILSYVGSKSSFSNTGFDYVLQISFNDYLKSLFSSILYERNLDEFAIYIVFL